MLIDLQLHSTYSDGYLTPSQLADFLSENNIKIASLTDHNTVAGLDEFNLACQKKKIKIINGLELYVKLNNKKFNILWYNFDQRQPELHSILRDSQIRRRRRVRNALLKLKNQHFKINEIDILDKYKNYIPINHVVDTVFNIQFNKRKIIKKLGIKNPSQEEIMKNIFKNPALTNLNESYININRVLKLRKKIGGQLILNHPGKYHQLKRDFILTLKKIGIDGMEVITPHHSIGAVMYAQRLAREYKLIMTGGSDFHLMEMDPFSAIKSCYNYFKINSQYLAGIKKIIK